MAREGENDQVHGELDQIGSDLDRATATFGPLAADLTKANRVKIAELDESRRSIDELQKGLSEKTAEAEHASRELTVARAELTDVRGDLAQHVADVESLSGEVSALRATLEDRSSEVADLNNALERSGRARAASEHESNLQIAAQRGVLADREAAFERL